MNIIHNMTMSATPVGLANPPTRPNLPGLSVNNHSPTVKFWAFILGSFTTTKPKQNN